MLAAVLIDPRRRVVQSVHLPEMPDLPECIELGPERFLLLDQASVFDPTVAPFIFEPHPSVLMGKALAFGLSIDEVAKSIVWVSTVMVCNGAISILRGRPRT
jgi:hypothetical protein